jgi:hypothetical protein
MNFLRPLICCIASLALHGQGIDLGAKGGGDLKIGTTSYQFVLTNLSSSPSKGGLPGAIKLVGNLVPKDGSGAFHMTLTLLNTGALYTLQIERRRGKAYPDTWAATVKTTTRLLRLDGHPGGRLELQCGGPLSGVVSQRPVNAEWAGLIWAIFPGGD